MITYNKLSLRDSTDTLLEMEYDTEEQCIRMQTSNGYAFIIPVAEWNDFIFKIQAIRQMLLGD